MAIVICRKQLRYKNEIFTIDFISEVLFKADEDWMIAITISIS